MKKQTTQQRLRQIMAERNLKQVDIINKTIPYQEKLKIKMSKNHLSNYINGRSTPDSMRTFLLSEALKVNPAWLMGYDVPMLEEKHIDNSLVIENTVFIMKQLEEPRQENVLNYAEEQLEEQKDDKIINISDVKNEIEYETLVVHGLESAGSGEWQEDDVDIEVQIPKKEIPTDFDDLAMVVGDSMRPYLHNADILFIKFTQQIEIGQIGVFRTSRGNFVKKLQQGYLESLNPDYDDIYFSEDEECEVIGVVVDYYRK